LPPLPDPPVPVAPPLPLRSPPLTGPHALSANAIATAQKGGAQRDRTDDGERGARLGAE